MAPTSHFTTTPPAPRCPAWGHGQRPIIDPEEAGLIREEVIISLGFLLLILAVIMLGLLKRLSGIRQAADTRIALMSSTLSGQYLPYDDMHYISLPHPGSKVRLSAHNLL